MTDLETLYAQVIAIQTHVQAFVDAHRALTAPTDSRYRASAENLLAYVGLRQLNLRRLQLDLGELGLSSLGRSEGFVLSSLRELRQRLEEAMTAHGASIQRSALPPVAATPGRDDAEQLLHQHTRALLGPRPGERHVYIMVTAEDQVPTESECAELITAGMNVLRINTAHGSAARWRETARVVRKVAAKLERSVLIEVDLAGPKLRTSAVKGGIFVLRYRPAKNLLGQVLEPLRVPMLAADAPAPRKGPPPLRAPLAWIQGAQLDDLIRTVDSRGRTRVFRVVEATGSNVELELKRTCYLTPACMLVWERHGEELGRAPVTEVPFIPGAVELRTGDRFYLAMDPVEGRPGVRNPHDQGVWLEPPLIGLEREGIRLELEKGQRVFLDDGKVEAVVESIQESTALARVVRTVRNTVKIRAEKGVNFPDSAIAASCLSNHDRRVLHEVLGFADIVGVSFVRSPSDLAEAIAAIRQAAGDKLPGVVVKLETALAVKMLPAVLLQAMQHYPVGVMIARGDLAVEVGFERLAELQQELMWFAEAAHLPVVWATQVLDTLARTGIPSRAEITDASMSVQAECVMLNKGPHVTEACRTLDGIIRKMEQHQHKKRNLFRPLQISLAMEPQPSPSEPQA